MFVFQWLISLSIKYSRCKHMAAIGRISFFLWLSIIPLCIITTSYLYIRLLMGTWVASISWLLHVTLLWTLTCMYLFKLVFWFLYIYIYIYIYIYTHRREVTVHMEVLFLFFDVFSCCYPQWLHQFTSTSTMHLSSLY